MFSFAFFDVIGHKVLEIGKILEIGWFVFFIAQFMKLSIIDLFVSNTNLVKLYIVTLVF